MPAPESRGERLAFRWSAAVAAGAIVLALLETHQLGGHGALADLGSYALTSILVLGKFVIFLGLREDARFGPWGLAVLVWLIDIAIAFAIASGLEGLERAPVLGGWLRRSRGRATAVLREYPGLERMAFFGVVAFVLIPIAATGAVTGSFAARLVGLPRLAGVLAIAIGSAGTAALFALLANFLGERAEDLARSPVLVGLSALLLLVIGRTAYLRVTDRLRRGR